MAKRAPWGNWSSVAESYGLIWCASHLGCPSGLAKYAHHRGRVDTYGQLHWEGFARRGNARGVRTVLMLIGLALHRKWRYEPYWYQLYLLQHWAAKECERRWRRRMINTRLRQDMIKAHMQLIKTKVGRKDMTDGCYLWYWRHGFSLSERAQKHRKFVVWMGHRSRYERDKMSGTGTVTN